MEIEATTEQRDYIKNLLEKGMGNRGTFDGVYYERLFGLIGQIIVSDLFGYPRPTDLNKPDELFDLEIDGKKYDVKTAINDFEYNNRLHFQVVAYQKKYNVDGYIFVAYDRNTGKYEIAGWISKLDFFLKAKFIKKGTPTRNPRFVYQADMYEIQGKQLNKMEKLTDRKVYKPY